MAAAFGSFSIREYASTMRTHDVVKSWPFGREPGEVKKETAEAFLPPITVAKFRWWSDELELLRSNRDKGNPEPGMERTTDGIQIVNEEVEAANLKASEEEKEKLEKVCPVCRVFAASTVNAVNAHIDGCLAQASTEQQWQMKKAPAKTKSRVPKKRSIAEIFAGAPPILEIAMVEHKKAENKHEDDLKQAENDKSNVSKSREVVSAMETLQSTKKKTKKKTKKDRILHENSVVIVKRLNKDKKKFTKGKREKLNPTKETRPQLNQDKGQCVLPFKKRRSNGILNIGSYRRNKTATKSSSKRKKNKHFEQEFNLTQKVLAAPSRSILKKKTKATTESDSEYHSLQAKDGEKFHGSQRPERRVRFSDKEETLGSESFAALNEKEKAIEGDEEGAPFEAGKIQSTDNHDYDEVPKCVRRLAEKSSCTNEVIIPRKRNPTLSNKNASSDTPGGVDVSEERFKLSAKTQVHRHVSEGFDSYRQLIDSLEDPIHAGGKSSVTKSSLSIPSPFSAFSENANSRFSNQSRSEAKPYGSTSEMVTGRFPFQVPGSRNHVDSEFFGLPLNSQGELIHLGSSTTNGFNLQMDSRSITSSSNSFPIHNAQILRTPGDYRTANQIHRIERELPPYHFNLFPGSQKVQLPVGVGELEGIRRAEIQWLNFERGTNQPVNPLTLDSNSSAFNISFNGCKHSGKLPSHIEYHEYPTQQTMRLMGKDVTIGRSTKELHGVEGGKFWRNCKNMVEYLPSPYHPSGNQAFVQCHLGQALVNQPWSEFNQRSSNLQMNNQSLSELNQRSSNLQMNNQSWSELNQRSSNLQMNNQSWSELNQRSSNLQMNNERGVPYRDGNEGGVSFDDNRRLNMHHNKSHSSSSGPIFSLPPYFQQPYVSGAEAVPFCGQPMLSSSQNSSQEMYGSASHSYKPILVPSNSALNFPFLRMSPDCRDRVQSPTFQGLSNLPPWISQSKQQEKAPCSSSGSLNCMNRSTFSHISPSNSIINHPSRNHDPRVPYPYNPMSSNSYRKNAPSSTPLFHPQFAPIIPGAKQSAAWNSLNIKDSGFYNKTNKRTPVDIPVYPRKSPKIPISQMHDYVSKFSRGNLAGGLQRGSTTVNLHSNQDGVGETSGCGQDAASNNTDIPFTNSPNIDSLARAGPIKLSAGAKHILKPSQAMDHDSMKPIHSTIPFAGFNNSVSFQETQKKPSQIYSL